MIADRGLVSVTKKGLPYNYGTMTRAQAEAAIAIRGGAADDWTLHPVPSCRCCGEPAWENQRCTKHQGRVPCAADGCARSTGRRTVHFICATHWKAYVPPGSPERRVLNRIAAQARKLGYARTDRWPDEFEARWWRVWTALAKRVERRSQEGLLDEREIARLFGW